MYDCSFGEKVEGAIPINVEKSKYFDKLPNFYKLTSALDTTLIFESRFESGNLH